MKMKNIDIINITDGLRKFDGKKKLPVKLGFAILKNYKEFEAAAKIIDEQRVRICEEHSEKDKNGKPIIKEDKFIIKDSKGLNNSLAELYSIETEISIHTISMETIEQCDENGFDKLSVTEMEILEFMIE
ncbi:MAG: hypothetical protein K2I03_08390 [Lachnospiraceae bacterium]|nr:hypothetical protein [Lachnospiraceae bacterium]